MSDAGASGPEITDPPTEPRKRIPSFQRQLFNVAFFVGFLAGLGTDLGDEATSGLKGVPAKDFLTGAGALGAAAAGIVIAVLALIAVWFDDRYQDVLKNRGGWVVAMRPFRIIGTVSVLTVLSAIASTFLLQVNVLAVKAVALGVTGGLLMWSLVGLLVVISLLFEHGKDRAELIQELREAKLVGLSLLLTEGNAPSEVSI